jgi:hypothetical protein
MPRVHNIDLKSVALQDLEKGYPINARCLHNDGLYTAVTGNPRSTGKSKKK